MFNFIVKKSNLSNSKYFFNFSNLIPSKNLNAFILIALGFFFILNSFLCQKIQAQINPNIKVNIQEEFEKANNLLKNPKTENDFFPFVDKLFEVKKNKENILDFISFYEKIANNYKIHQHKDGYINLVSDLCFMYREAYGENEKIFNQKLNNILTIEKNIQDACKKTQIMGILAMTYTLKFEENLEKILKYFKEAEQIAKKNNCSLALSTIYENMAKDLYERTDQYPKALEYYQKAIDMLEDAPEKNPNVIMDLYYQIGLLHYNSRNYLGALPYLEKTENYQKTQKIENRQAIQTLNTTALCYEREKKFEQAIFYYKKGIQLAKKINDEIWVGIFNVNLGGLYGVQRDYDNILAPTQEGLKIIEKSPEWAIITNAYLNLSVYYGEKKKIFNQKIYLQKVDSILNHVKDIIKDENTYFQKTIFLRRTHTGQYATFLQKQKDFEQASIFWQTYHRLNVKGDSLVKQRQISFKEKNLALEKIMLKVQKSEEKQQQNTQRFLLIVGFLSVFLIIFGGLIYVYRLRATVFKAQNEALEVTNEAQNKKNQYLEEEMAIKEEWIKVQEIQKKQEIRQKEQELTTIALQLYQKSDLIDQINEDIQELKDLTPIEQQEMRINIKNMQSSLKNDTHLDTDWETFRNHFQQVHPDFFVNLQKIYPNLSPADMRVCVYYRLNLENKTIAKLLNVTPKSLSIARNRLRKKMSLPPETDITKMLLNI